MVERTGSSKATSDFAHPTATQRELRSIENGLRRLQESLHVSDEVFGRWVGAVRAGADAVPPVEVETSG